MEVGSRVLVVGGKSGVVRFMGPTEFAQGEWVGIELDTPDGKNDGEINGVRYFTCEPLFGLFAKKSQVRLARISLGYGASNPLATSGAQTSTTTSRLQQMREKRSSTSNLAPPSVNASTSTTAKKTVSKVDTTSKINPSLLPRKSPSMSKPRGSPLSPANDLPPKPIAVEAPPAPQPSVELTQAQERIELLMDELESKNQRIQDLEEEVVAIKAEAEEAAKSAEEAAKSAEEAEKSAEEAARSEDAAEKSAEEKIEEDSGTQEIEEKEVVVSPRAAYEDKLRSLRDEGIALASKMRKDFEIQVTKMEKGWEDKEAQFVEVRERLELELSSLENECVALRARNAQFLSSEHAKAEEIAQWQAKIGVVTRKADQYLAQINELNDTIEMLTLEKETLQMDKEIADERIEEIEAELETAKLGASMNWGGTATESVSGDVQEENAKLRVAVKALHERSTTEKSELTKQVKDLTKQVGELSRYRDEVETISVKLATADASVEELKEMLDMASAYESMVETLTETNLSLGDQVADLKASVASLESLKEMSDEMEHQNDLLAKELQNELAVAKQKILDLQQAAQLASTSLDDKDRTIARFRDLVQRNREEMTSLREKLRLEAGELETMKDTTHSIMNQSLQLRQALQAARASGLDASRYKLHAHEMRIEHGWWQQLVPTNILQDTDRRHIQVRLASLRVSTKCRWLLDAMSKPLFDPSMGTDGGSRSAEVSLASQLLTLRRLVHHAMQQLTRTTSNEKWMDLLSHLDGPASVIQIESLVDAALTEWSQDGQLSSGSEQQPGVADRLVHACKEWTRILATKLEAAPATTVSAMKLAIRSNAFELGLHCRAHDDAELRQVVWQLLSRLDVDLGNEDSEDDENEHKVVVAGGVNSAPEQLGVLVAYSKSVTSLPPFIERIKAWSKNVSKGALQDALSPVEASTSGSPHVPLHELRAEQIRSELAQAANLMLAIEETTEVCHKLQARIKEMEKHESHGRMLIAKHEQEIARLNEEATCHGDALQKLKDQMETERQQCDALLTEQHKERAALEATNRTLRKQMRRTSEQMTKKIPETVPVATEDLVSKKALIVLQQQLQAVRTEIARTRLEAIVAPVNIQPTSTGITSCMQEVAGLTSRLLAQSSLPDLVDLKKSKRAPVDANLAKFLGECNRIREKVVDVVHQDPWGKEIEEAVKNGEVWFTGRSCDQRQQEHSLPLRPMGRLIFPHGSHDGPAVPVVLSAAEMHLLSRAITLA